MASLAGGLEFGESTTGQPPDAQQYTSARVMLVDALELTRSSMRPL